MGFDLGPSDVMAIFEFKSQTGQNGFVDGQWHISPHWTMTGGKSGEAK
jgi:hypothetical protein